MNSSAFDIDVFIETLKRNYRFWNAPIVTFIANRGATPFEILVSTLLSLRTKDQVTASAAEQLFKVARTPQQLLKLDEKQIQSLIYPVGFYPTKSKRLLEISTILVEQYGGKVPDELEELLKLPGVGRKTANLVLIEGFHKAAICVDTHVHRISNRIGYIKTNSADETEFALLKKLPQKYWNIYNELVVAFGQVICKPVSPLCSQCPVNNMCPQINVKQSR